MGMEENKKTALKYIDSLSAGAIDLSLLTDDVQWWAPGRGMMSKAKFLAVADAFRAKAKDKIRFQIHGITAEGDRVAVEAESFAELTDGRIYNNTYHFLFVFRDGRICLSKGYNDTRRAAEIASA